jgi:AI-2 transport protein TqsA
MQRDNAVNELGAARIWLTIASAIIIIGGMKLAQTIIVPFLLALFIAAICSPLFFYLQRRGLNQGLALLSVLLAIVVIFFLFAALIGTSVSGFSQALPTYEARLSGLAKEFEGWLAELGIVESEMNLFSTFDPSGIMSMAGRVFSGFSQILSNSLLILLIVVFLVLELSLFRKKLQARSRNSVTQVDLIFGNLNRYFSIKTLISLATGTVIGIAMFIIGVDFPVLWGLLAFLLNYIPTIGSIIAAIPPVLLALIQFGPAEAAGVAAIFVAVNFIIGSIIEPRLMGTHLGLSTLVIFLSLIFWGWVLGTVGMLLSVPLTMTIKIALDSNANTRWIGALIGDAKSLERYEEGKEMAL